jgi:hypothetical protein
VEEGACIELCERMRGAEAIGRPWLGLRQLVHQIGGLVRPAVPAAGLGPHFLDQPDRFIPEGA